MRRDDRSSGRKERSPRTRRTASALAVGRERHWRCSARTTGQATGSIARCCSSPTISRCATISLARCVVDIKDHDAAIELLGPYFERVVSPTQIKHMDADPDLDPIRDDARFDKMLSAAKQRLGMMRRSAMREPAHVFVSYARSSEGQANLAAEALRGAGYSVWRDDELPAHRSLCRSHRGASEERESRSGTVVGGSRKIAMGSR